MNLYKLHSNPAQLYMASQILQEKTSKILYELADLITDRDTSLHDLIEWKNDNPEYSSAISKLMLNIFNSNQADLAVEYSKKIDNKYVPNLAQSLKNFSEEKWESYQFAWGHHPDSPQPPGKDLPYFVQKLMLEFIKTGRAKDGNHYGIYDYAGALADNRDGRFEEAKKILVPYVEKHVKTPSHALAMYWALFGESGGRWSGIEDMLRQDPDI